MEVKEEKLFTLQMEETFISCGSREESFFFAERFRSKDEVLFIELKAEESYF